MHHLACKVDAGEEELLWIEVQQAGVDVHTLKEHHCSCRDFAWEPDQLTCLLDFAAIVAQQLSSLICFHSVELATCRHVSSCPQQDDCCYVQPAVT